MIDVSHYISGIAICAIWDYGAAIHGGGVGMSKGGRFLFGVAKLAIWTAGVLLFFRAVAYFVGGDFVDIYAPVGGVCTVFIVYFSDLIKRFRLPGDEEGGQTASSILPAQLNEANVISLYGGSQAMAENPKVIIQSPGNVTINNNTTHNNVQGGIIGNGTVNVHQYGDRTPPMPAPPAAQSADPVVLIPMKDTANLDELLEYAEKLVGKAIAENTVRNILERADVESCGEENRGRARPKLYPKEQAEKAIADYAIAYKGK